MHKTHYFFLYERYAKYYYGINHRQEFQCDGLKMYKILINYTAEFLLIFGFKINIISVISSKVVEVGMCLFFIYTTQQIDSIHSRID